MIQLDSQKNDKTENKDKNQESSEDEDHLDIFTDEDFLAICPGDNNVWVDTIFIIIYVIFLLKLCLWFFFFFSEIVGIVESTEKEALVGKTEKTKQLLKKFTIGNRETKRIRGLIWQRDKINDLQDIVRDGYVSENYF